MVKILGFDEAKWLERYEEEVRMMTLKYEQLNKSSPVNTYRVNSEEEANELIEALFQKRKKEDDGWIKI